MRNSIITALLCCFAGILNVQAEGKPLELTDDAPDRYTVVQGDTLWSIATKFLKDPWRWSELWQSNWGEVNNPHRIYPGQVIMLDRSGGDPKLKVGQMIATGGSAKPTEKLSPRTYESKKDEAAIPAIPIPQIRPFLSEPRIVSPEEIENAPRIVATQEGRVLLGLGNLAYSSPLSSEATVWQAFRPAKPILDPGTGEVLGHEAFYVGTLKLVRRGYVKDLSTLEVASVKREMGVGDRLLPARKQDISGFIPHPLVRPMYGRIASIYEGVGEAGPYSIVTINLGQKQGLEPGHVMSIHRMSRGLESRDGASEEGYMLPSERVGLLMVFSVHERLSHALVMSAKRPVTVGDLLWLP